MPSQPQHLHSLPVELRVPTVRALQPSPIPDRLNIKNNPFLKKRFTSTGKLWDDLKLNSPNRVGGVMELIKKHQPTTHQEWEQVYLTHGKPLTRLQGVAVCLHLKSTPLISLQEAIDFTFIRVIDETWEGWHLEKLVIELLETTQLFDEVRTATKFEDNRYGIDIICLTNGQVVAGIQVKPDSYFKMKPSHKAKRENHNRNQRFLAQYPQAEVHYVSRSDVLQGQLLWVDKKHYAYTPTQALAA